MNRPLVRAEAIIYDDKGEKVLVQCDMEESFYRFPGGSIEYSETAVEAIKRELIEEYELSIEVGSLACINESIIQFDGKKMHNCTLLHWCSIDKSVVVDYLVHKENPEIKLVWRSLDQINQRPLYPEGIYDLLISREEHIAHLIVRENYDK